MSTDVRPIILKRKKVYAAEGHHGGAWKVAYADFVTAMMAFFLLMWLLNATTEEQRKGISDYFNPNIPIAAVSGGGSNALQGETVFSQKTLAKNGTGSQDDRTANESSLNKEVQRLNEALAKEAPEIAEHLSLKMSDEGLVIEITDNIDQSLFEIGNAQPSQLLVRLLDIVAGAFSTVENNIKVVGHTDSRAYESGARYSNWELSADRANTARRLLMKSGFPSNQISEVSGKADTDHVTENGLAAKNRRISITILKS